MLSRTLLSIAAAAALVVTPAAPAQQSVPKGAKVLLLSGGQRNHHGYRRQAQLLQKALEDTRQFQVTICEDAAILETPALQKYDGIVATADRRDAEFRLTESQQRALLKFVQDGKGFFSLHGFCCADRNWIPEMRELLGGVLAHFGTPDTKVKFGKFVLKIADPSHPVTAGVSDFEHQDELYYDLQTRGELKPLAVAVFEDREWPVLWTRTFGKGNVCVSVFGHCGVQPSAKDPLEHEPFRRLVLQGIAWTVGRELAAKDRTEQPDPRQKDAPGGGTVDSTREKGRPPAISSSVSSKTKPLLEALGEERGALSLAARQTSPMLKVHVLLGVAEAKAKQRAAKD